MENSEKSYAVYAEKALALVPMQPAWNRRVFNTTESEHGNAIRRDQEGIITLLPGTYRIRACSIVNYFPDLPEAENGAQAHASPPSSRAFEKPTHPGYCMLRFHPGLEAIATGTIANADFQLPSMVDVFLDVAETKQIKIEHQVGGTDEDVADVYLQVGGNISTNHVFARMSIEKIA